MTQQSSTRVQEFGKRIRHIPRDQWNKRLNRLDSTMKELYHITDSNAAQLIIKSNKMLRGRGGLGGAGIYFATSVADASKKAHASGVLITCKVRLGNVKTLPQIDSSVTFNSLFKEGYDSVLLSGVSTGLEYVVYNCDQVYIMEVKEMASGKILHTGTVPVATNRGYQNNPPPRRSRSASHLGPHSPTHFGNGGAGNRQNQRPHTGSRVTDSRMWPARLQRLQSSQIVVLFYITNERIAGKIAQSGKVLRGNGGIAGPGIYLYSTKQYARSEMTGHVTVLITCRVQLGNVKRISSRGDQRITFRSLLNDGYDSVCVPGSQGDVLVVYNSDQVNVMNIERMRNGANASRSSSAYDFNGAAAYNGNGDTWESSAAFDDGRDRRRSRSVRSDADEDTQSHYSLEDSYDLSSNDGDETPRRFSGASASASNQPQNYYARDFRGPPPMTHRNELEDYKKSKNSFFKRCAIM